MTQFLMKKCILLTIILFLIGAAVVPNINGIILETINDSNSNDEIYITYNFEVPSLSKVKIAGIDYNRLIAPGLDPANQPGEPLIPSKGAYILLPPESKNIEIKVTAIGENYIISKYYIEPMEIPIPISEVIKSQPPRPDKKIYENNSFYPGKLFTEVGRYYFRGYQILVLLLHPIQYNPVIGEINFFQELNVTIKTSSLKEMSPLFRGLENDKKEVEIKVDNPKEISLYGQFQITPVNLKSEYDLLIITTEEFKSHFQKLKEDHDLRGIFTEIKTLSDIGVPKNPENIRDFIINEYNSNGIEYVLLGGDADVIPAKMIYVTGMDEDKWPINANMPVDLYYACLDEEGPKDNGGDLIAEVYVGRACAGNSIEVLNFCNKTLTYLDKRRGNDIYLDDVLLAGEYKGDYGIASYGGNQMDQLIDECSDDGYTTIGFPSSEYNIDKLYDRDLPYEWNYQDIVNKMNAGKHFIIHTGHAYYNHNMRLNSGIFTSEILNNYEKPFFAYSTGCKSGGFDDPEGGSDCIAEYFTVKSNSGAFAGIWNARWGFFWSFRLDGDSSRYQREFVDAIFEEKIYNIAKANQDSREDNLHLIERSCMRFVYYGLNLFGDPSVSFHIRFSPEKPEIPEGPTTVKVGEEQNYSTLSNNQEGNELYYLWDWGDGKFSNWLGPFDSGVTCEAMHIWDTDGSYDIKVKAKDHYGEESLWSDPLSITLSKKKSISLIPRIIIWLFEEFPFLQLYRSIFI